MKNNEPGKARMMAFYEKKQMYGAQLEPVSGGRGFFNAPDNPTCKE